MDLLNRLGFPEDARAEVLGVGGNNRVWKVHAKGRDYAVKQYFRAAGGRDRFASEERFIAYAELLGIRAVPHIAHKDAGLGVIVFDWVEGRKPVPGEIGRAQVDQAIAFFAALQEGRAFAGDLPIAAEACFSMEHHLACVDRRLQVLRNIPPEEDADREALAWVRSDLLPAWETIRAALEEQDAERAACGKCLSPSDFGFHNAIAGANGQWTFLDFEYAGWDDPAKAVCDFFCQPAVPVPSEFMGTFTEALVPLFPEDGFLAKRISLLMPVYQLKWCAICLNEFLPEHRQARAFAGRPLRKPEQLEKAVALARKARNAA
jgi:hypothetical protein